MCAQVMERMTHGPCGLHAVNGVGAVNRVGQGRVLQPQCLAMDQRLRKEDAIWPPVHNVQYQSLYLMSEFHMTKRFSRFQMTLYFVCFSASQCQRCTNAKNNGECNKQKTEICSADQVTHYLTRLNTIYSIMLFVAYLRD